MAVGALDTTVFDPALKSQYSPKRQFNVAMKGKPFLQAVTKNTKMGGSGTKEFIQYGNPQGVSGTIADAIANASTVLTKCWNLTSKKLYGVSVIDGLAIATSQTDADAFLRALDAQVGGTLDSDGQRLAKFLYGNGGGALARAASGKATATITLTDKYDIVNFQADMKLEVSDTDGTSGSVRTGEVTVKSVDRKLGTITIIDSETAWTTQIAQMADNDYIFADGDFGTAGFGLKSWLLDTAATATTHAGVDRSSDNRLYGQYYDGSGENPADALKHGLFYSMLENDNQNLKIFTHPAQVRDLIDLMDAKVHYVQNAAQSGTGPSGDIGFKSVRMVTPMGEVEVVPDRYCDSNIAWALAMDTITLHSVGPFPRILGEGKDEDGMYILRRVNSDDYEVRTGGYYQLGISTPGRSVRIKMPTPA